MTRTVALLLLAAGTVVLHQACVLDRAGRGNSTAVGGAGGATPDGGVGGVPTGGLGGEGGNGGALTAAGGSGGAVNTGGEVTAGGSGGSGGGVVTQSCPSGQFATGIDGAGQLACAPIAATTKDAFNENCSLYWGWRDNCNGCTDDPAKWGRVSGDNCFDGAGSSNSCLKPTLGAESVSLFGVNPDLNVDDTDTFHIGMNCAEPPDLPAAGPCAAGSFVSGVNGGTVDCVTAHGAITRYVQNRCGVYLGWRDSCDGCTAGPAKWGLAGQTTCVDAAGDDNTCIQPTLDGVSVHMFGVNTDGDVNGDDKFYVGFRCTGAVDTSGPAPTGTCPLGSLVVAVSSDGTVTCASPDEAVQEVVQQDCHIYLGWRDSCNGCDDPPTKWGRASTNDCTAGAGSDNTCETPQLGASTVHMFGLNTDNGVDGNDKFHVGLSCF